MPLVQIKGKQYHINPFVKQGLDEIKIKVMKNDDMCTSIVDGRHGSGKSTLAAQLAYYLSDGEITLDDVVYSPQEFVNKLKTVKPGGHIILDEAFDTINKRNSRSGANLQVLSLMQKMRVKKAFIWIVLPYIFDLDKNAVLGVCDYLFHCWRKDFGKRGHYSVYRRDKVRKLYLDYRQFYTYPMKVVYPNLHPCGFNSFFPFNDEDYQKKKLDSFIQLSEKKPVKNKLSERYRNERDYLVRYMIHNKYITQTELCGVMNMSQQNISRIIKAGEQQ